MSRFVSQGRARAAALLGAALALATALPVGAQDEYGVKAAFLFNFAKFVEWPADAFAAPDAGLVLCVAGASGVDAAVQETVKGKLVNGRPIEVKRVAEGEVRGCHLLFIADGRDRAAALMEGARSSSVLTVGETPGFTQLGGVINFTTEDSKVRFEINEDAARKARLKISSKLLSLAKNAGS